jgi:hypothetical protein
MGPTQVVGGEPVEGPADTLGTEPYREGSKTTGAPRTEAQFGEVLRDYTDRGAGCVPVSPYSEGPKRRNVLEAPPPGRLRLTGRALGRIRPQRGAR